jgi:HK97 family phage prohead protease
MDIINKALTSPVEQVVGTTAPTYRFVISDETEDRDSDIILQDSWDFSEFEKNSICLLQHDHKSPIGKWSNIQKTNINGVKSVVADLTLAPPVSDILRYANALVENGILNCTSVGFGVKNFERRKDAQGRPRKGMIVHKAVLREVSLVSVPANANAIRIAKSLNISNDVVKTLVSIEGSDSAVDLDDDTSLPLSVALDKAQTLLANAHKSSKKDPNSVFGQVKITDERLLQAYTKAKDVLSK